MKKIRRTAWLLPVFVVLLPAQEKKPDDIWQPLRFLVGSWTGTASGRFGEGASERTYRFVLNDSFLQGVGKVTYKPNERVPQGEIHEEWGFYSYDREAGKLILRQFHNESIYNEYVHTETSPDHKAVVFTTRNMENFRPGWRARETYKILGPDEFIETFELAGPGKEFTVYVENRFQRKRVRP